MAHIDDGVFGQGRARAPDDYVHCLDDHQFLVHDAAGSEPKVPAVQADFASGHVLRHHGEVVPVRLLRKRRADAPGSMPPLASRPSVPGQCAQRFAAPAARHPVAGRVQRCVKGRPLATERADDAARVGVVGFGVERRADRDDLAHLRSELLGQLAHTKRPSRLRPIKVALGPKGISISAVGASASHASSSP